MTNSEANQKVKALAKKFKAMKAITDNNDAYFKEYEILKVELKNLILVVGLIGVLSAKNLILLCAMQSTLRAVEPYSFLAKISTAADELELF